jgi:rare lipoprotein A
MSLRIPTVGLLLALLGAALVLPAAAAADNGGTAAPGPSSNGAVDPSFVLTTGGPLFVGGTLQISGVESSAANRTVQIQQRDPAGAWLPVTTTNADQNGSFATTWSPPSAGQYELRAAIEGAQASDAGTASTTRTVFVYKAARASWYGPGFYGKHTACGQRLGRATLGVANRHLACGTQVALTYKGRSIVVPVIDRGPFARGIQWDLTSATARKLGVTVTSRIGEVPLTLRLDTPAI